MYLKATLTYLVLLILVVTGCRNQEEALVSIDLNLANEKAVNEVFDSVTIIPLKDNGEPFFPALGDLIVTESHIIGRDDYQNIFIFDKEGNLQADSRHVVGHGNGEYYNLLGYTYNPFSNTIEVLTPLDLKIYGMDFHFIKSVSLGNKYPRNDLEAELGFYDKIMDIGPTLHALFRSGSSDSCSSVTFYDSGKEKVVGNYDFSGDVLVNATMQKRCLQFVGDTIYFYPPAVGEYVYTLDPETLRLHRKCKIEGLGLKDYKDADTELMLTSGELMPIMFLCTANHSFFLTKEGNTMSDMSLVVFDRHGDASKIHLKKDDKLQMPIPAATFGNTLYGLADDYNICEIISSMDRACADSLTMYPNIVVGYFDP